MVEAHGDGTWLYLSGKVKDAGPNDGVEALLRFHPPQVYLDTDQYVQIPITGTYSELINVDARSLKGIGVTVFGTDHDSRALLTKESDSFFGGDGRDVVKGRAGDDYILGSDGNDKLIGKLGNDTLNGGNHKDLLKGNGGDDDLYGGAADDILNGGSGDDRLFGGTGFNKLSGDGGNDLLDGTLGYDLALFEGRESDYAITIVGGNYQITDLREGSPDGTDTFAYVEELKFADGRITMAPLISELSAAASGDTLTVSGAAAQNDPAYLVGIALSFSDADGQAWVIDNSIIPLIVEVANNSDQLVTVDATGVTGSGVSVSSAETAYLSPQGDFFVSSTHESLAYGYGGNDTLYGDNFHDELYGGAGNDLIIGDTPFLFSWDNDQAGDLLDGGGGSDTIDGLAGDDTIIGGAGNDELWGGTDDDFIDGGDGEDVAVFQGDRASYTIYEENGQLIVDGEGSIWGKDTLVGIETLRFGDGDVSVESLQFEAHPANAFAGGRPTGPLASSMLPQPIETHMMSEIAAPELLIA